MQDIALFVITLIVIIIFFKLLIILHSRRKRKRLLRSSMREIDIMNGCLFEEYLEILFKNQGYKVKSTPSHNDFGADLIITKGNDKKAVQVKRTKNKVGIKAVQEVVASVKFYDCNSASVMTNNYFTKSAIKLAAKNDVELLDRDILMKKISKVI